MYTDIAAITVPFVLFWGVFYLILRSCKREPSFTGLTLPLLCLSLLAWSAATAFNIHYHIELEGFYDGVLHEDKAREVASKFSRGRLGLSEIVVVGNRAYRLILGIFYGLTHVDSSVIYTMNAAFTFCGMLWILEGVCRYFKAERCPIWLLGLAMFSPSLLFWGTKNLKEGLIMLSIGLIVSWFTPRSRQRTNGQNIGFGIGCVILFLLRPHICAAWLGGMAIAHMQPVQNLGKSLITGFAFIAVAIGAFVSIDIVRPGFLQNVTQDGLVRTLEDKYESRKHIGTTAIYGQGNPVPVGTGLAIIGLSPPPAFWGSPSWLILGLESLAITSATIGAWLFIAPNRLRLLAIPAVTGAVYVILLMAFYMSYTYNMGLAIRVKMQVIPALLILVSAAVFQRQLEGFNSDDETYAEDEMYLYDQTYTEDETIPNY